MKIITALLTVLALTACASDKEYAAYITAQQQANTQAAADQKPLVRLTAQPGQTITGLGGLEVYMPTSAPVIQQARQNEWAGVMQSAIGVTGTVLGIRVAGQAAVGLADSVGRAGTAGYAHVQAPGAVTTNTMTGSTGTLGSGSYDATHAPTVVVQPAPVQIPAPITVNPVVVNPVVVTQPAPPIYTPIVDLVPLP